MKDVIRSFTQISKSKITQVPFLCVTESTLFFFMMKQSGFCFSEFTSHNYTHHGDGQVTKLCSPQFVTGRPWWECEETNSFWQRSGVQIAWLKVISFSFWWLSKAEISGIFFIPCFNFSDNFVLQCVSVISLHIVRYSVHLKICFSSCSSYPGF